MEFGIIFGPTDGCCGITQVHSFSDEVDDYDWGNRPDIRGYGNDEIEAYQDLFNRLMTYSPKPYGNGRLFQMWFQKSIDYKGDFEENYLAEPLRLLIETIPNVMNLGEYVNYKSGNKIQGYQWEHKI